MKKRYTRLRFPFSDPDSSDRLDLLVDALAETGSIGFELEDGHVSVWFGPADLSETQLRQISGLLREHGVQSDPSLHVEEEKNWNAIWESTIKPQRIGRFLVRPSWEASEVSDEGVTEIVIDPKMSFGTGSHATTHMILETIGGLDLAGKHVLDAGTGTGILAIAAMKRGAASVFAFDEDEWSDVNARENMLLNGLSDGIDLREGRFDVIPPNNCFDVIFANINTHVLLAEMGTLNRHLKPGGTLVMTGILASEGEKIRFRFLEEGLVETESKTMHEWILFQVSKEGEEAVKGDAIRAEETSEASGQAEGGGLDDEGATKANIRQDREWVSKTLSGEASAFSLLMDKYRGALAFHVRGYLRDHDLIDDLVQEVFIKAYENLASYNPAYAFSTWIYRIATNHAIDHLRKRRIRAVSIHDPIQSKDGEIERELPDHTYAPDREVMREQRRTILHDAIERLPEKYREVIRMRHMDEMSYQEISEALDLPLGTVKAHIFRAREALQKSLKDRRDSF